MLLQYKRQLVQATVYSGQEQTLARKFEFILNKQWNAVAIVSIIAVSFYELHIDIQFLFTFFLFFYIDNTSN